MTKFNIIRKAIKRENELYMQALNTYLDKMDWDISEWLSDEEYKEYEKARAIMTGSEDANERLEYLRTQIEDECISTSEILELQSLVDYIDPKDTVLLAWAGVPEN